MRTISARQPETRHPSVEPMATIVERVMDNIGKRNGKPEFETGLDVVDRGIFGYQKSQLSVIAARPGIGKTSFACQQALHLARSGKRVAFLSLEMTKETITERIFCNEYGVNGFDLLMGRVDEGTKEKLSKFHLSVQGLPLKIIDDYCHTENELYTLIEHLNFRPDIIFLDHIQHIRSTDRKSQYENLTDYLRYLKEIAMRYEIALVVLSQINRQGEDAPSIANLKGSGAIEEMSDHVLLMHLEKDLNCDENFRIQIAKNRFGPVGTFSLFFDGSTYRFFNNRHEAKMAGAI